MNSHSWRLISKDTAIKRLDKSAFVHGATGIPKDIRHFFRFDNTKEGERKEVIIQYKSNDFDFTTVFVNEITEFI